MVIFDNHLEKLLEDAVFELGRAAAALGEEAATLTRACDGFGHLVAAIRTVRAGAEAWWAKWRQSKIGREVDMEAHLLAKDLRLSHSHKGATIADIPAAGQDSDRRSQRISGCSAMQGCSLLASLTVLPYMGPDGVLKTDVYTPWYHRCAGAAFSLMWCLVGLHFYSRLFSRIGMLAVTQLVIFYSHWLLFPDWVVALWVLVTVSAFLHIGLFIWACIDGDM
ncbi:hypothetical protein GQ55_5G055500 [Panicum hallii var. hallii]|uniref:Uncharacterized protein n=1 Tax=Panicum hallii var. hallii TaxID=1504633 RepID=A0A2T7DD48_9POAL|nr:hypothetical protein GQ55_5G055500 [Panicum hallii var. hallii]